MVAAFQSPGHMAAVSEGSAMAGPNLVVLQSPVMTDEQMETLRKQICVYSTICTQLVEMHKALCQQQPSPLPGYMIGQHMLYDLAGGLPGFRSSARQRWTPSQTQLKILEGLFDQGIATPNKQKIKEITMELGQHGQISETNVYNWFQNRKARAKRKQLPQKEGESEFETDDEFPREKKCKPECDSNPDNAESGLCESNAQVLQGNHSTINKPYIADFKQNGIQDNMSSTLLQAEDERKPHVSFGQTMHGGVNSGNDFIEFLSEVKSLDASNKFDGLVHGITQTVSSNVGDFRRMFGDNSMLMDSHGHMVSTNDMQTTLYSRHLQ